ncbi:uncharacterized protein LOC129237538 isoform X1 [Anastrepha obliqua]|uniref:uncharacterized protein LOC129237538 isoform X1 n=2 Tax=Anastrepha obliqua TaxID=95512 RepID=UPI00240A3D2F|nr:uncharacterized protein LOC129237538 isoform X1 [Anastrepha obliqua]XP_054728321.1 uncharacterized protein LOC129237538 isoform X1 [Anastrepha obliqua]
MTDFPVVDINTDIDFPALLANLKRACDLWFRNEHTASKELGGENSYCSSYDNITTTITEILRHGLRLKINNAMMPNNISPVSMTRNNICLAINDDFKKLVDNFEWICRSAQIRTSFATESTISPLPFINESFDTSSAMQHAVKSFLRSWVQRNLKAKCMNACFQILFGEKQLLEAYYKEDAFLRNEAYSTALLISLSAVELNQYSLLSQIETKLYSPEFGVAALSAVPSTIRRRTSYHRILSISPPRNRNVDKIGVVNTQEMRIGNISDCSTNQKTAFKKTSPKSSFATTFRRTKSLPALQHNPCETFLLFQEKLRPGSNNNLKTGSKRNINALNVTGFSDSNTNSTTTTDSSYSENNFLDLGLPSTSLQSRQQMRTGSISSSNAGTPCRIELINCDDIKIWTDTSYDHIRNQRHELQKEATATEPCPIPQNLEPLKQKAKSSSPIGSFLCNLFSTPPTYTHWSILNQSGSSYDVSLDNREGNTAIAMFPCNPIQSADYAVSSTGGVLNAFMPVCGKKLRSRNSQNLFEDGISTLDYKNTINDSSKEATEENCIKLSEAPKQLPKHQQSLTDFLQTSQMSRNNTDLEKENAHFRVSEAIISAIEHIKWDNSTDPVKKWRRRKESNRSTLATTATDCLATDGTHKNRLPAKFESESCDESTEHISYAELGESCLDLLSAEVVGLSLISKFNDKHLPKVSELKWLVSEEDTPQQLLPMPDNSSANPDDNIIHPMTRGTRYWAPPRQQIIFTDHPSTSRKELIRKQNNRCAGCGMRVSRQYVNSFRYCTYLGKFHCTGCHRNQISPIPAKILQTWDFKCYPVSVFSYRLLEQMYLYPLFYVPDLNPALYIDNKALLSARKKRVHLKFVKDFIKCCRFAVREQVYFESIPDHITNDSDIWSLSDFIDVHNKSMQRSIDQLIEKCEHHIFNCVLCTARGFHCQYCHKDQVIYPWQQKVFRCDGCGSCFHLSCWNSMSSMCCRCQRINKRREIAVT